MNKHLKQANIKFPEYWNEELVIEKLQTLRDEELYEFFGCSNKQSFTRKMNPFFPKKDQKTSFFKYLKDALDTPIKEIKVKIREEPYPYNG